MKKLLKSALILTLALTIALSSMILVTAEETAPSDDEVTISQSGGDGTLPRAMEIVWKYRYYNGVLQKRRWNATLGVWYDPYWINV